MLALPAKPLRFDARAAKPASGDWTMWGGTPHRNMVSGEKNPPTDWDVGDKDDPKDNKNIKWEAALGSKAYVSKHFGYYTNRSGSGRAGLRG